MSNRKSLPTIVVPKEGYDLLSDFAYDNRLTLGEAVRQLLAESPRLKQYAEEASRQVNLQVETRGGWRQKKEE